MSKFRIGDKVICVKNTPQNQEGWIGYICNTGCDAFGYWAVANPGEDGYTCGFAFTEDELELLEAFMQDVEQPQKEQSALDVQIGGEHYKSKGIQPIEYAHANNLGFMEANVVKYVSRHQDKHGAEDIKKAIHYCKFILELKYGIKE